MVGTEDPAEPTCVVAGRDYLPKTRRWWCRFCLDGWASQPCQNLEANRRRTDVEIELCRAEKVEEEIMANGRGRRRRRSTKAADTAQAAMAAVMAMLKDDGLVGVVQHRAPANSDDATADGSRGYLKQAAVVALFEEAGFKLLSSSEINANSRDQPGPKDIVWRLPPSLTDSKDDPSRKAAMLAIGESDRMTLLFGKAKP